MVNRVKICLLNDRLFECGPFPRRLVLCASFKGPYCDLSVDKNFWAECVVEVELVDLGV